MTEDIGNTPYDASLEIVEKDGSKQQYLLGIKTFGFRAEWQKIAQLKAFNSQFQPLISQMKANATQLDSVGAITDANKALYLSVAKEVAKIRNARLASAESNIRGFIPNTTTTSKIYHVLMPHNNGAKPEISVGETSYTPINIAQIEILRCTGVKGNGITNFEFTDGIHNYKFTPADNELYMNFSNKSIVKETWDVEFVDDAFAVFERIASLIPQKDDLKSSSIIESYTWPIANAQGSVELFSGFNSFYSVGSKLSTAYREENIQKFLQGLKSHIPLCIKKNLKSKLGQFLDSNFKDKLEKVRLRDECVEILKRYGNNNELNDLRKLVFRPMRELYIPIPNARQFHTEHPDFFVKDFGGFHPEKPSKLMRSKDELTFNLKFEPSGHVIEAFITQDNGKAIMSKKSQEILGRWILEEIFQLPPYRPLTKHDLLTVGINAIRLYRTNDDNDVHIEFVWNEEFAQLDGVNEL